MALRGRVRDHRRMPPPVDETKSRNWRTTAYVIGSHHREPEFQPSRLSLVLSPSRANPPMRHGKLSSSDIGMHAELPRARFQRAKSATPIFPPAGEYVRYHKTLHETPVPLWLQGARSSDIYGGKAPKRSLNGAAANHYEAQFARSDAFNGRRTNLVTEETHAAVKWQQKAIAEADRLQRAIVEPEWKTGHSAAECAPSPSPSPREAWLPRARALPAPVSSLV